MSCCSFCYGISERGGLKGLISYYVLSVSHACSVADFGSAIRPLLVGVVLLFFQYLNWPNLCSAACLTEKQSLR